jgi:type II secretory pathway pseudopilin PulG
MRPTPILKAEAFTRIELIGVIVLLVVLAPALLLPLGRRTKKAQRISCINNLKQIGVAYRIWSNDHGDRFPASQSVVLGGCRELLTNTDRGFLCWANYATMSNELGQSPKLLVCPLDQRKPADTFSNFDSNTNLSYLVGVGTDDNYPQSLLGGDRNLGAGTEPDRNYGFSPENGQGNDVAIQTNSKTGPVCWSLKIHSLGTNYCGNILLGDGSSQQVSSGNFRANWQPNFNPTTNWPAGHVPPSPSIRVLFP